MFTPLTVSLPYTKGVEVDAGPNAVVEAVAPGVALLLLCGASTAGARFCGFRRHCCLAALTWPVHDNKRINNPRGSSLADIVARPAIGSKEVGGGRGYTSTIDKRDGSGQVIKTTDKNNETSACLLILKHIADNAA